MSNVTRQALRVYAALTELRDRRGDVLDALIPFFEPILALMNGRIFDPRLFALGVQKLYRWPFTRDIAEQFIPRLVKKGYLERVGMAREAAYLVKFSAPGQIGDNQIPIANVLEEIVTEFESFPPRVTDLLAYKKTRDELADILVRFLVSLDAYAETSLIREVERAALGEEATSLVDQLEPGGAPLSHDDRYMCARFVHYLCHDKPQYVPHLATLASVGLLTEVVADFVKPTQPPGKVDLTVVVDAPLALDYLGCSGKALQDDARTIFDALRSIGCNFLVFAASCGEMKRNLDSMLARDPAKRDGYTHEAMVRNEVMADFVIAVARDPEAALNRVGVGVRHLDLDQFPNTHPYFDDEHYEDFLASVNWVQDIAPREHDATCLALIMRLRNGRHNSDLFRCGYVFVTRNSTFVKQSRSYCIENGMLNSVQQGPIIHQRELATVAWLRTGLGASEDIPRGHLIAICERVLMVRPEVKRAVASVLSQVTPEKLEQFDLLLADQKSLRKLADETLNDESVVTAQNAERLLELMKAAAIEKERAEFDAKLQAEKARHAAAERLAAETASRVASERDAARALVAADERRRSALLVQAVDETNRICRRIARVCSWLLITVGALALLDLTTHALSAEGRSALMTSIWNGIVVGSGVLGGYYLILDVLEKPKIGVASILNWLARTLFSFKLRQKGLDDSVSIDRLVVKDGQIVGVGPEPSRSQVP